MEKNGSKPAKRICVFCSSSDAVEPVFLEAADELGALIAGEGHTLIYGGGNLGLMGRLACAVHQNGGTVVGIIPDAMHKKTRPLGFKHELVSTVDMRERKTLMELRSDAFIALPGGFGTLEEILEMLTLKQLEYHSKPIVLVNTKGFYDGLLRFFEELYEGKFANLKHKKLYHVAANPAEAMAYLGDTILR